MTDSTYLAVANMGDSMDEVTATGATPEEARSRLPKEDRDGYVEFFFTNEGRGSMIPLTIMEKLPAPLEGHGILLMTESCHSSGSIKSKYHVFAVPLGQHRTGRHHVVHGNVKGESDIAFESSGTMPWCIDVLDSNSEYHYPLPAGSMEWTDGVWKPCEKVEYGY